MTDWDSIGQQFFVKQDIKLWAFGHYHKALFNVVGQHKVGLLQAPTLKVRPYESAPRGFTLVELIRSAKRVNEVKIYFYELGELGVQKVKPEPVVMTI